MVISPALSSGAFFGPALYSLQNANDQLSISTARLSSGNRLYRIGDDVASFSVASRLQSEISVLKQAALNTAQSDSLLQVAAGGLTQVRDILDRLTAVATESNSGSLSATDRSYLQQEFSELVEEIDRIAANTKFNGIALLDGTFSGENRPTLTTSNATQASGSLVFSGNLTTGETVKLNGQTFIADTDFTVGGSLEVTLDHLIDVLNGSTNSAISGATYARSGTTTLTITADSGGTLGNNYYIDQNGSTASFTTNGTATNATDIYTLSGGLDDGLGINSVKATGTIGDTLVNTQSQTQAAVTLFITGTISDSETLSIDDGNGGTVDFSFKTTASADTDIQIGADTAETLRNAIQTITDYTADATNTDTYVLKQLEFVRDGDNLIIRNRNVGDVNDLSSVVANVSESITNATLSGSDFSSGTTTGVNVSGVNNSSFVGSISGFTATYTGADAVTASLIVGSTTYSATISDTTPATATPVRFNSTTGGYFDVQLASGGLTVSNQSTADTYAARLNSAFAGLTFYQERQIAGYSGTGTLVGSSASIQTDDFSDIKIDSIEVTAPSGSGQDATIDITVDGEIFRSDSGIGGALGIGETIRFTSLLDSSRSISLTGGTTANDFSDSTAAATFESTLRTAFGLNSAGQGVNFQVGTSTADTINVVIGNVSSSQLFGGATPNVSSQGNAASAITTLETATNNLQTELARVGAFQARLASASNNISQTITGLNSARSALADTDIAEESTNYAQQTLKINAAVAVIAQTTNLQSSLLQALQLNS